MRAMVAIILRAGDPASPLSRRRALDAVTGAGESGYDEDALEADLGEPADTARPKIGALGAQLQIEAREWCLAEAIRIAMADGPLTGAERAAAEHLAALLGMTQAQAIGVIALTEQNAVLPPGESPVTPLRTGESLPQNKGSPSTLHIPLAGASPGSAPAAPGTQSVVAVVGPLLSPGESQKRSPPRCGCGNLGRLRRAVAGVRVSAGLPASDLRGLAWAGAAGTTDPFGLICSPLLCRTSCSSLAAAAGAYKGWLPRRGSLACPLAANRTTSPPRITKD